MTQRLGQSLVAQRDFVANAAHQLRTPLTGLRLRLESAGLKTDDPALQRDLAASEREADRLSRTVTDLLTLAREGQRPAAVAPLVLSGAGRAAVERWEAVAAERACGLRLSDEAGAATVAASGEDVAVVLDNLVENAIEHTGARHDRHDRADGRRRRGGSPSATRVPGRRPARRSRPSSASSAAARRPAARRAAAWACRSCGPSPAAGAARPRWPAARAAARAPRSASRGPPASPSRQTTARRPAPWEKLTRWDP